MADEVDESIIVTLSVILSSDQTEQLARVGEMFGRSAVGLTMEGVDTTVSFTHVSNEYVDDEDQDDDE